MRTEDEEATDAMVGYLFGERTDLRMFIAIKKLISDKSYYHSDLWEDFHSLKFHLERLICLLGH